uniref:Lysophosphatidylcholine acyltransferase 1 n=1 Tax=Fundulus heteroclitus TaxID=8078 RepID=A0A3Q2UL70_FUNHE
RWESLTAPSPFGHTIQLGVGDPGPFPPHFISLEPTLETSIQGMLTPNIGLMSVTVFPVRLLLVSFLMLLAWPFAFTASLGRSELVPDPQSWWRRLIDLCLRVIMRAMWFCGGFHWIKVKGERAQPSEVPILTVAPHSSYFDAIPVTMTMCSIVTKLESRSIPIWGSKSLTYPRLLPVFVFRSDQHSRRKTVEEIKRRAQSGGSWPQIMIFPEGTCTNRSGLILFKAGAFIPGLPVQPVVLRYPNKLDTVSWTWHGPGALKILWLTLCQPHNAVEIEYLPIYYPSMKERDDPALFASNVRTLMAKALEVPLTDLSFDDRDIILSRGPLTQSLSLLFLFFYHGRLKAGTRDNVLEEEARRATKLQGDRLGLEDFAQFLNLPVTDALRQVHNLFDQMYEEEDSGEVAEDDLASILEIMLGVKEVELSPLLLELQAAGSGKITYGETLFFCIMLFGVVWKSALHYNHLL